MKLVYDYENLGYAVLLTRELNSDKQELLLQGDNATQFLEDIDRLSDDMLTYYVSQYF